MSKKQRVTLEVEVPDFGELGPAMQALKTDRQRAFVTAMLEIGGGSGQYTRAALMAGYIDGPAIHVTAHRLAHDPLVQEALREEAHRRLGASVISATSTLISIAESDVLVSTKDRLKAIDMILNRTGLPAQTEVKHTVIKRTSDEDIVDRIKMLAGKLGLDAQKLLGRPIVDAEFEEVGSTEGLEDLL